MKPLRALGRWFDAGELSATAAATGQGAAAIPTDPEHGQHIDWLRVLPFVAIHLACLGVFWVGMSATAVVVTLALYWLRMFAVTAFYHRYFSHRSYRTSRGFQLVMALWGSTAVQRGPLWWASHHRHHHAYSDEPTDPHSPRWKGLLRSHLLWFLTNDAFATRVHFVKDWLRYPELRLLDRFDWLAPLLLASGLYGAGEALAHWAPGLGTSGPQLLTWGFFVSTVLVYHATYTINSLAHVIGKRRYDTPDDSRNNWWLALLTLGEGWHNNHHHYPRAARQGFFWYEIDPTYYALRLFAALGLIWDLKPVPAHVLAAERHP